jgi:hypothetical protein
MKTRIWMVMLVAVGLAHGLSAHADQIVKAATTMVYETGSDTYSFNTPGAGTVTAEITTVPWPSPLSALSFSAMTGSETLASWSTTSPSMTPYVETFQVSGAGTYFAHVIATAGSNPFNLGAYSLLFTFSPSAVPLPTSAGLMLIGLLVLLALRTTLRSPRNESVMYPA